jgi:hypothetical protein
MLSAGQEEGKGPDVAAPAAAGTSAMKSSRRRTDIPPASEGLKAEIRAWYGATGKGWAAGVEEFRGRCRPGETSAIIKEEVKTRKALGLKAKKSGGLATTQLGYGVCVEFARMVRASEAGAAAAGPTPVDPFGYPAAAVDDVVDIVYMLHQPLTPESRKNARGEMAKTIRVLEKAWKLLDIDPEAIGQQVMISEINPVVGSTGTIDWSARVFEDACREAMEFALLCSSDIIIVFGTPAYNRWMQTIHSCAGVQSTEMVYEEALDDEVMHVTRTDETTVRVMFVGHPSAGHLFRDVVNTIAHAHGKAAILQRVPVVRMIEELRLVPGECQFVRMEVEGSGRFVLGDGCITHNCYENIIGGLVHASFKDLTGGITDEVALDAPDSGAFDGRLWQRLFSYYKEGYLMGCGNPKPSAGNFTAVNGIIQGQWQPGHGLALDG